MECLAGQSSWLGVQHFDESSAGEMDQVEKESRAWTSAAVTQGLAGQQKAAGQASLAVEPETA